MRPFLRLTVLAVLVLSWSASAGAQLAPRANPDAPATAYVGGQWWDGERFAARDTTWAAGGVFVAGPLAAPERVVDLGDEWVVPPYGDAHTHMLSDAWQGPRQAEQFQAEGVLYALVITDRHSWAAQVMDQFDGPGSIDVAYTHGGLTSEGTHPTQVYEWQALRLVGQELTAGRRRQIHESRLAEDDAYWVLDTMADVEAKWDSFLAHQPDAVKVYLLDSAAELGPQTSGMTGLPSGRGLSPEVLAAVVERAHAAGLPVYAHVETAADVRLALAAGADGLAHLPGYSATEDGPFVLDDATVAAFGAGELVVIPTSVVGVGRPDGRPAREAMNRDLHRRTLRRLHAAGARVALGADRWSTTSRAEADYMEAHRFFDRPTLLRLWTETTPQVVFPGRAIGRLSAGFEASLLALACDPTADWSCTRQIDRREKQGTDLDPPVPAPRRTARANPDARTTAYVGGLWYTADGAFTRRDTVWAQGGVFVAERPARVEITVDLGDRYIVPPFADAHVHRVEGSWALDWVVKDHLGAGTFYVKNLNNIARYARMIAEDVNRPGGIDVAFAHGGITAPGAHPFPLYRRLAESVYRNLDPDALDGVAGWGVATVEDLDRRWPEVLAERPDHIKLYLLDHESGTGLQPDVFRRAVALARQAGLRTSVHVATVADLALAVDAGADEAAHMPPMFRAGEAFVIGPDLVARIAARGFVVTPTVGVTDGNDVEAKEAVQALQAANVRRLLDAGAFVATGTDGFGTSAIDEAATLVRIGAMTPAQAVYSLTQTGAVSIFPDRAIGRLAPGYEASFLALTCDPTADLGCARQIRQRVKQGAPLPEPTPSESQTTSSLD